MLHHIEIINYTALRLFRLKQEHKQQNSLVFIQINLSILYLDNLTQTASEKSAANRKNLAESSDVVDSEVSYHSLGTAPASHANTHTRKVSNDTIAAKKSFLRKYSSF
jgi:hypothetical protein